MQHQRNEQDTTEEQTQSVKQFIRTTHIQYTTYITYLLST